VIASQAVRLVSTSPEWGSAAAGKARRGRRVSAVPTRRTPHRGRAGEVPLRREAARRALGSSSWDLRIFGIAIATIVFAFGLALLYVSQTTALSVAGYDVQKRAAERDELLRQNALLEVQVARLDSPARIAAGAQRLGMVHARYVPVIPAQPLIAKR